MAVAGRNIQGITIQIDGDTTELGKALKEVNQNLKSTQSELKDVDKLLKLDPTNTVLLTQKQELLGKQIINVTEKLKTLNDAQKQLDASGVDKASSEYQGLEREIIACQQELAKLIAQENKARWAGVEQFGKSLTTVGKNLTSTGRTMSTYLTAPIVALGTAVVTTASNFESQMSKVQAISGATGDELDTLKATAMEWGARTKFSATEAGQAMEYMGMAGWKADQMVAGLPGILNLAAAGGAELGTTSDIVTDALTAFGLEAKDAGTFADIMAQAITNSNTNIGLLGESFKYAAPLIGSMRGTVEDTAIALGLMANAGIKGEQAGTNLRAGLVRLVKPTKEVSDAMKQYGISLKTESDGALNLRDTMIDLRTKMSDLSEEERTSAAAAIFGRQALSGWLAIINASDEDFKKLIKNIDDNTGAAQEMADIMQDNLQGEITKLKSALEGVAIQLGNILIPKIREVVKSIQNWVTWFGNLDTKTQTTIVKIAALVAAIGPLLVIIGSLISSVGSIITGFSKLASGIGTLIKQFSAGVGAGGKLATAIQALNGPIGIIIAAIAGLVTAFITLWNTNDQFRTNVMLAWSQVVAAWRQLEETVLEGLKEIGLDFGSFGEMISTAWTALCDALGPAMEGALGIVLRVIQTILDDIRHILQIFIGVFTGDWELFWEGCSGFVTDTWDGIADVVDIGGSTIETYINATLSSIGSDWQISWEGIKAFTGSIWHDIADTIVGACQDLADSVIGITQNMGSMLSTIWEGIGSGLSWIWDNIGFGAKAAFADTGENIKNENESIKTVVLEKWDFIKDSVTKIATDLGTGVSNAWSQMKDNATKRNEEIKGNVDTQWDKIKTSLTDSGSKISSAVSNTWNALKEKVTAGNQQINTDTTSKWTTIKQNLTTAGTNISTSLSTAWNNLKNTLSTGNQGIQTDMTSKWTNIKTSLSSDGQNILTNLSNTWNNIKTTLSSQNQGIQGDVNTKWNAVKTTLTTLGTNISSSLSTTWNTIKNNLSTSNTGIQTDATSKWQNIRNSLSSAGTGISSSLVSVWNNIRNSLSSTNSGIQSDATNKFNTMRTSLSSAASSISSAVTSGWNQMKNSLSSVGMSIQYDQVSKWNTLKDKLSLSATNIKDKMKQSWDTMKNTLTNSQSSIYFAMSNAWENLKNTLASKNDSIRTTIQGKWDTIKSNFDSSLSSIKSKIEVSFGTMGTTIGTKLTSWISTMQTKMSTASTTISSALTTITNKFKNLSWSFPKIKLPHFSLTGSFSLNPPSVPKLSVNWYKKAMDNGMILNNPTIFGMQNGRLLGGGEAGPEAIMGLGSLVDSIYNAVNSAMAAGNQTRTTNFGNFTFNVYGAEGQNVNELADEIADIFRNQVAREAHAWA